MQKFVACGKQPLPYPFYFLDWFFFSLKAACRFRSSTSLLKQFLFCNENVVALHCACSSFPPQQYWLKYLAFFYSLLYKSKDKVI